MKSPPDDSPKRKKIHDFRHALAEYAFCVECGDQAMKDRYLERLAKLYEAEVR